MNWKYLTISFCFLLLFSYCKKEPDDAPAPIDLLSIPTTLTLNPAGITPLAALATINTNQETRVQFTLMGEKGFSHDFKTFSTNHNLPILGLKPGSVNQIIITVTSGEGIQQKDTFNITTEPLPNYMPDIEIIVADTNRMEPGMHLSELNISGDGKFSTQPIIFDHTGEIRWFIKLDFTGGWTAPFERLRNGNFLFARNTKVYEYDILGRRIQTWEIPNGWQHHDVIEKPDGNLIVPITSANAATWMDHFIELNRATGAVEREWDIRSSLDIDRFELHYDETDWIHTNSIFFDERDEGLVISGRNQGVFKVSKNDELLWILAPHKGWGLNGNNQPTSDFLLTAVDASGTPYNNAIQEGAEGHPDFDWTWGQHAAMLLPNGNVLVYDNGWRRNFSPSTLNGYSRVVEYEIDETAMTVKQVWQYGKERGLETYSGNISDVDYLPETGNRLFAPGNIFTSSVKQGKIIEITYPEGAVVFEASINYKNSTSTGSGWGAADLIYRSERLNLYPQ